MNPGWYPDPYSDGYLRWWDGSQWTAHAVPAKAAQFQAEDPRQDLAKEHRASRRAALAVIGTAVLGIGNVVFFATVYGSRFHDFFNEVRAYDDGRRPMLPRSPG